MNKIILSIFLLIFLLLFCSKNLEEEYNNLELEAKEALLKQDNKKIIEILEELNDIEKEETEKKIHMLDKTNSQDSIYYLSPSRNLFLFSKKDKINLYYKGNLIQTDLKKPDEIFSSFSGNFWIFRYKENKENCNDQFYRIDFKTNLSQIEFTKIYDYITTCSNIVLTDSGKIYEEKNGNIYLIDNKQKQVKIIFNQFIKLFKKNPHRIFLVSLPKKGFWIFFGNAGYYDLYYYDETSLRLIFRGVAQPKVYNVIEKLFEEDKTQENYYLVFTGAAGQYTLTGFILPDTIWKSFNIDYNDKYVYIKDQNVFLYRDEENLYILNPDNDKEIQLPIKIKDFFVFSDSLILLTEYGLYVRKEPFSNLEKKIFVLKEELLYNIR